MKTDYFNIGPQLTYRITEELSLSPGYRFGLYQDNANGVRTANAQIVWLMLNYTKLAVTSEKPPTPVGTKPASTTGIEKPITAAGTLPFNFLVAYKLQK